MQGFHEISLGVRAISIACGSNHSLILTAQGSVFSMGTKCQHGQLGLGAIEDAAQPVQIKREQARFARFRFCALTSSQSSLMLCKSHAAAITASLLQVAACGAGVPERAIVLEMET